MSSFRRKTPRCRLPRLSRQEGFAYLWTLFLVAFMGIGLSIAGDVYLTSVTRDKERELIFIGREFRTAIARYYESNVAGGQRQYPASLEDLLKDPRHPNTQRLLRRIYVDPMTGKNEWGTVLVQGRIAGVYSLSGKKPIKQDNFEATEASFKGKEKYAEWAFTYPSDLLLIPQINASATDAAGTSRQVTVPVAPGPVPSPVPMPGSRSLPGQEPLPMR